MDVKRIKSFVIIIIILVNALSSCERSNETSSNDTSSFVENSIVNSESKESIIESTVLLNKANNIVFKAFLFNLLWIGTACFLCMTGVHIIWFSTVSVPYRAIHF